MSPGTGFGKFVKEEQVNNSTINFWYGETDDKSLANAVKTMFTSEGYKLEEGTDSNGTYGKGSAGMRMILGGFVDRQKFSIKITEEDAMQKLQFSAGMSGLSGGALGKSKTDREFSRLAPKFK